MTKPLYNWKVETKNGNHKVVGSDFAIDQDTGALVILSGQINVPNTVFARGFWERCSPVDLAPVEMATAEGLVG